MLLEVKNVDKNFGGIKAITGVSFDIRKGEILGIIGPNGSGKSTLYNMITGFYPATRGTILFKGEDITRMPAHKIALKGITRTFQATTIFNNLSVLDNLLIATRARRRMNVVDALLRSPRMRKDEKASLDKAVESLEFMELQGTERRMASQLTSAEQKRLAIAIALANEPELLLLDEPTGGLNVSELEEIITLIKRIRDMGITIGVIEHKMRVLMTVSDRVLCINKGAFVALGTPAEVSVNPEVVKSYLGERYAAKN